MEFVLSRKNFNLLTVPPMCWMAFKGLEKGESILINTIDIMHDPNEAENINISEIKSQNVEHSFEFNLYILVKVC